MVVVRVRRVEQTQDFVISRFFEGGLQIFDEVFVDLVPKVAQILPKVAPNPWDFGFGQIRIQVRNLLVVQCKFSTDPSLPRIPLYSTRFSLESLLPALKFLGPGP